jgi:hypothetical protein
MEDELKIHEHVKTLKSMWVFAVKTDDFNKPKFKARLLALGYSQRPNIDYMEAYAPVASNEMLLVLK